MPKLRSWRLQTEAGTAASPTRRDANANAPDVERRALHVVAANRDGDGDGAGERRGDRLHLHRELRGDRARLRLLDDFHAAELRLQIGAEQVIDCLLYTSRCV